MSSEDDSGFDPSVYIQGFDTLDNELKKLNSKPSSSPQITPSKNIKPSNDLDYVRTINYHWLYSARGGYWWHFDPDSNETLEMAHIMQADQVELKISGHTIEAYLDRMIQISTNGATRELKRVEDLQGLKLRGIGGDRYNYELLIPTQPHSGTQSQNPLVQYSSLTHANLSV